MSKDGLYFSFGSESNAENQRAINSYGKSMLEASERSVAHRSRDFSGLTTNLSGKPGFRQGDMDYFRPDREIPVKSKEIIAYGRYAYRRIGIIRNTIDLMGDFACQGVRITHKQKSIQDFYVEWFDRVGGKEISERFCNYLFREANVVIRQKTAKINKDKRKEMQRSVAKPDMVAELNNDSFSKGEIPWSYNFIDPILVNVVGGPVANFAGKKFYVLNLPTSFRTSIKKFLGSIENEASLQREIEKQLSPEILKALDTNSPILLPPEKTFVYHYKKDDWQEWADPMVYACATDLNLYQQLKLADAAALDGASNKIRVWKLGSLDHKIAPTVELTDALAEMLGANVGGGTIDIVWGPDIELLETNTDLQAFLGEEKYAPTITAIYQTLGIPPTLTGGTGSAGPSNNFISLKTLTERLNYVRNILTNFWSSQVKQVQKAMGFRSPATIEYDYMYLDDPAAMMTILNGLVDRNIISEEFIQRQVKAVPEIEEHRIKREQAKREKSDMPKASPFHNAEKDHDLKKIALQNGIVSPSQVGMELEEKGEDKSLMDMKLEEADKRQKQMQQNKPPGNSGRPKNSVDTKPRKQRVFKPSTKAATQIWARQLYEKISKELNGVLVKAYDKKNMRELTQAEVSEIEYIKFSILNTIEPFSDISVQDIAEATDSVLSCKGEKLSKQRASVAGLKEFLKENSDALGRKLSIEEIRNAIVFFYTELLEEPSIEVLND